MRAAARRKWSRASSWEPLRQQQVSGHRRQQVIAAQVGAVEERQHDLEAGLRAEGLRGRDAAVELDDR